MERQMEFKPVSGVEGVVARESVHALLPRASATHEVVPRERSFHVTVGEEVGIAATSG